MQMLSMKHLVLSLNTQKCFCYLKKVLCQSRELLVRFSDAIQRHISKSCLESWDFTFSAQDSDDLIERPQSNHILICISRCIICDVANK